MGNKSNIWGDLPTVDDYFDPSEDQIEIEKLNYELKITRAIVDVIRENKDEFLWEPCDCGCPSQSTARSKAAVDIIRLLKALE